MMTRPERLNDLAQTVEALFVERRGAWRAEDFVAVAGLLGFDAQPRQTSLPTPRPLASNALADLLGVNLAHALAIYDWAGWRPLTDDGVTIAGFWNPAQTPEPPEGYVLDASSQFLRRAAQVI
jgi:hypothetical protein